MKKLSTILRTTKEKPVLSGSRWLERDGSERRVCAVTALAIALNPNAKIDDGFITIRNKPETLIDYVSRRTKISTGLIHIISSAFIRSHHTHGFETAAKVAEMIENGTPVDEIHKQVFSQESPLYA